MEPASGKGCLWPASAVVLFIGVAAFCVVWFNTSDLRAALSIGAAATGLAIGVPLFLFLPSWLAVAGQVVAAKAVGLRVWHIQTVAFVAARGRSGNMIWDWSPSLSRPPHVLVTVDRFEDAQRRIVVLIRGRIYGFCATVLLYGLLGFWWSSTVHSSGPFVIIALLLLAAGWRTSEATLAVDRLNQDSRFAEELLARHVLLYHDYAMVRPRDYDKAALRAVEESKNAFTLGFLLAYWFDVAPCGPEMKAVRERLEAAIEDASPLATLGAKEQLAYTSAVCDRDLNAAIEWMEGDLMFRFGQVISWRNSALMAIWVLQGKREEAESMRARYIACEMPPDYRQYVEEQLERVMGLAP